MHELYVAVLFAFHYGFSKVDAASVNSTTIDGLYTLYASTSGEGWNWGDELSAGPIWNFDAVNQSDPCADISLGAVAAWQGVVCDSLPATCADPGTICEVISLTLTDFNMVGTIPSKIGVLSALATLRLDLNSLNGNIPSELGLLARLEILHLDGNFLHSTVPSALGLLTALTRLDLDENSLTGSIPKSLSGLVRLEKLVFENNFLMGTIPTVLGLLSSLKQLWLNSNCLEGIIPTELGNLIQLQFLVLEKNCLQGTIPTEIGKLSSLKELWIDENILEGSLPLELGSLMQLERMILERNYLQGTIPVELGQLSSLLQLEMDYNCLEGTIPLELASLSLLQRLALNSNLLQGSIPSKLAFLSSISSLWLHANNFEGTIPAELGLLSSLVDLRLGYSSLEGTIPSALGKLSRLSHLNIENNCLQGTIPTEIGKLSSLKELWLDNNRLEGTIPSVLNQLMSLELLYVHFNCLNGTIPAELGLLSSLVDLRLGYNSLEGTIPSALGKLSRLSHLNIENNCLQGAIPTEIGKLSSLKELWLDNNRLEGTIPSVLGQLSRLEVLVMSQNSLRGSIPTEVGMMSSLIQLLLSGNDLEGDIPSGLGGLVQLLGLRLELNKLQGTIPSELGLLPALNELRLHTNMLVGSIPSSLGNLTFLTVLTLQQCSLYGTIPPSLGNLQLQILELQSNSLYGSLPDTFANLSSLILFRIDNNQLSGELSGLFTIWARTGKSILETIDISNNLFSGSFPSALFQLPKLKSLAAVSACFEGELPDTLCMPPMLEVLILNGLSNADGCHRKSSIDFNSFFGAMTGTIPSCVYAISSLKSLSIVNNGFFGSLGVLSVNSSLLSLKVSHNHLTGSIPAEYLRHPFRELELSYNRISHSITALKFSNRSESKLTLTLEVNRLSGNLPSSVDSTNIDGLNVLRGNSFACSKDSNRAENDPSKANTRCGSSDLNFALFLLFSVVLIIVVSTVICFWNWHKLNFFILLSNRIRSSVCLLSNLNNFGPGAAFLKRYIIIISILCGASIVCTTIICVTYSLLIGFLKYGNGEGQYETHFYQYSYYMSTAMLSGKLPAALLIAVWSLLVLLLCKLLTYGEAIFHGAADSVVQTTAQPGQRPLSHMFLTLLLLIINTALSLGLSAAYIAALVSDSSELPAIGLQLLLGGFRIMWNRVVFIILSNPIFCFDRNMISAALIYVFLFNNILAPCLVVIFADPSCFVDLFIKPSDITSVYSYEVCGFTTLNSDGYSECIDYNDYVTSVTYSPIFVYNFQCGTSLIKSFAPVVILSYSMSIVISIFLICLANYDEFLVRSIKPGRLELYLPKIIINSANITDRNEGFSEGEAAHHKRSDMALFNYPFETALMSERLLMLFTFGLTSPYVAFVCGLSAFIIWLRISFTIFLYIDKRDAANNPQILSDLNNNADGIQYFTMHRVYVAVCLASCLFLGLFTFDTAADEGASWDVVTLIIVMPIILSITLCFWSLYLIKLQGNINHSANISTASCDKGDLFLINKIAGSSDHGL